MAHEQAEAKRSRSGTPCLTIALNNDGLRLSGTECLTYLLLACYACSAISLAW